MNRALGFGKSHKRGFGFGGAGGLLAMLAWQNRHRIAGMFKNVQNRRARAY